MRSLAQDPFAGATRLIDERPSIAQEEEDGGKRDRQIEQPLAERETGADGEIARGGEPGLDEAWEIAQVLRQAVPGVDELGPEHGQVEEPLRRRRHAQLEQLADGFEKQRDRIGDLPTDEDER